MQDILTLCFCMFAYLCEYTYIIALTPFQTRNSHETNYVNSGFGEWLQPSLPSTKLNTAYSALLVYVNGKAPPQKKKTQYSVVHHL